MSLVGFKRTGRDLEKADVEYLRKLAKDTWDCIAYFVNPDTGMPYDTSSRGRNTSATNIGLYLAGLHAQPLSTTCANGTHRVRAPGGGRKPLTDVDEKRMGDLDRLLDPATRGDPMSPLRWTCKSPPKLAKELQAMGHRASPSTIWRLPDEMGYSMQSNRKTYEGGKHPDRNAPFEFINESIPDFQQRGLPVISVDTKKKELVGQYRNGGREWPPKGVPVEVNVYDFLDPVKGNVSPCGVYEIGRNVGWVSVGISHDTSEFAVESIRRWWLARLPDRPGTSHHG
jgi:hypothetical protein